MGFGRDALATGCLQRAETRREALRRERTFVSNSVQVHQLSLETPTGTVSQLVKLNWEFEPKRKEGALIKVLVEE